MTQLVLGRYTVFAPIAGGGMATVHLGRSSGPGDARTVAIKRLHPQLAGEPEFLKMFIDEVRITARIGHPNVVPVLDVQLVDGGELIMVMEYVHGTSLARLLHAAHERATPVPVGVAAAIVSNLLRGLHSAHEARGAEGEVLRIVHRDVSPHNVLVGVDGVARVADFGVAAAAGQLHLTNAGQVKGKLAYMAPEQLKNQRLTRNCDVYAASVVLWEALTGRALYSGDNDALIEQVLLNFLEPPSKYTPSLPDEVDALVLKGLAGNPARRFATALDMAVELERCLPLASPHTVGEWVLTTAHAELAERQRLLDALDHSPEPVTIPSAAGHARSETDLAPTVTTNPGRRAAVRTRLALIATGLVLTAALIALRAASPSAPQQAQPARKPPAAVSVAPVADTPAPEIAPEPLPPVEPEPPPRAPVPASKTPRAKAKNPCQPPYTIDASGKIVFKRACL